MVGHVEEYFNLMMFIQLLTTYAGVGCGTLMALYVRIFFGKSNI